jgi:hypothetical protein
MTICTVVARIKHAIPVGTGDVETLRMRRMVQWSTLTLATIPTRNVTRQRCALIQGSRHGARQIASETRREGEGASL